MRRWQAVAAALVVGAATTGTGYAVEASASGTEVLGPGVVHLDVGIDHSHFSIGKLRVRQGTLVEFAVHNGDPIAHELIVGDAAVHRAHEQGTEQRHPPRPGEVSVDAGHDALTFYEFDQPGTIVYACHLPGHEAYGMKGEIEVVPAD